MKNMFGSSYTMFLKVYLPLIAIFGFFGNLVVCIIFCGTTIHQSSMNPLIVNLAIADMLQCLNLLFMITAINELPWFTNTALCRLNGITMTVFIGTSILSLTVIGINRYLIIVKKSTETFFTRRNTLIIILFVWLYPLALSIVPFFGRPKYVFAPHDLVCISSVEYQIVNYSTLNVIPFVILCFCTWNILRTMNRTRKRVTEQKLSRSEERKRERNVTLMLLVVIITYFVFYAPGFIVFSIQAMKHEVALWVRSLTIMIGMLNHVNNPLIYGVMNGHFRQAVLRLFCRKKARSVLRSNPVQ